MRQVSGVALCSVMLLIGACGQKGTFVVVHLDKAGTVQASINHIELDLSLAGKTATTTLTNPGGGDLTFPTDAVLDVRSGSGQLDVTAIAFDGSGTEVSRTTASVAVQRDATASLSLVFGGTTTVGDDMTMPPADLAGSNITISATSHDYGTVVTGMNGSFSFTVTNNGSVSTSSLTTQISGTDSALFTLMNDTCNGTALIAGGSCTLAVVYAPTAAGTHAATLNVHGSGADAAVASLSGVAVGPAALAIAPSTGHDFGAFLPGVASSPFTFTVTNNGGVTSGVLTAGVTGSMAGEFTISNDSCTNMTLPAGGTSSCSFDVTFTPGGTGMRGATLTVRGTPGGTAVAPLSGTGQNPAMLAVHGGVTSHDFMIVQPGSLSSIFTIQIDNTGDVASGVPVPSITGTDAGEFAYANHCTAAIPAGGNCTVDLTFSPSTGGSKSATFSLMATPGGTASITLAGQAPPTAPGGVVSCSGTAFLRVFFTPVTGATSYNMYVSTTTPVNRATATKVAGISTIIGGSGACATNTTCYAIVTAVNAYGESPNSTETSGFSAPGPANFVVAGDFSNNAIDFWDNFSGLGASTPNPSRTISGPLTGLNNPTSIVLSRGFNDLYVASRGNGTVRVWHGVPTVNGNTLATHVLTGFNAPGYVGLDNGKQRLYVVDQGVIKVFNHACALNGAVAPDATLTVTNVNPFEIFVDDLHDMLYIASNSTFRGVAVVHQVSTLTGSVTKAADRSITITTAPANPTYLGAAVDLGNDFLYVGINNGAAYNLVNASTLNGAIVPTSTATGATPYVHGDGQIMVDFTDCSATIKAWVGTNPFAAAPGKLLNTSRSGTCYESAFFLP